MSKKELPVPLIRREFIWGLRYLLFQLVFLGPLLTIVLTLIFPQVQGIHLDTAYFLVNFSAVAGIFHRFLWLSLKHGITSWPKLLLIALLGFGSYWLLSTGLDAIIHLAWPEFQNINDAGIAQDSRAQFWLTAFGTVLLVPLAEETLFRGLIFGALRNKNRIIAYAVSVLLFAFVHVMGYVGIAPLHTLLLCILQYIPAGIVLAFAYEYSGSILTPILIHTAVNAVAILSMR